MKKLLSVLLIIITIFTIASCTVKAPNDPEKSTPSASKPANNLEMPKTDHTIEQLELKLLNFPDLTNASIWRDAEGEYYIYINEWSAFRHLPELSSHNSLDLNDRCMVVNDETATISVIDQSGKHDEPTILTYHLSKDTKPAEVHTVLLDIKENREEYIFFVNMHSAKHGYYFSIWTGVGVLGGPGDLPLYMFETTDGGKTWNQIATNTFHFYDKIEIFKFVSPQVGIISSRDIASEELFDRTYFTVDGGLTWNLMSELPHDEGVEWYSDVIDFEYDKDDERYYLTVKAYDNDSSFMLRFMSKDLTSWSLYNYY